MERKTEKDKGDRKHNSKCIRQKDPKKNSLID